MCAPTMPVLYIQQPVNDQSMRQQVKLNKMASHNHSIKATTKRLTSCCSNLYCRVLHVSKSYTDFAAMCAAQLEFARLMSRRAHIDHTYKLTSNATSSMDSHLIVSNRLHMIVYVYVYRSTSIKAGIQERTNLSTVAIN